MPLRLMHSNFRSSRNSPRLRDSGRPAIAASNSSVQSFWITFHCSRGSLAYPTYVAPLSSAHVTKSRLRLYSTDVLGPTETTAFSASSLHSCLMLLHRSSESPAVLKNTGVVVGVMSFAPFASRHRV